MRSEVRVVRCATLDCVKQLMKKIDVSDEGIEIMAPKSVFRVVKVERIRAAPASIIKQEMLARGGEAAISAEAYYLDSDCQTDVLLFGTLTQFKYLAKKLKRQPYGLRGVAEDIEAALKDDEAPATSVRIGGRSKRFGKRVGVIGILNVTADSFFDGGKYDDFERAVDHGRNLAKDGADVIEIGGESARPGEPINASDEIARVVPVIEELARQISVPIAVDTYKWEVAKEALASGAKIINDITGFADDRMVRLAVEQGAAVVVMHIKGRPKVAQAGPEYVSIMGEIIAYLRERTGKLLSAGLDKRRIMIDPGPGFAKTTTQNLVMIKEFQDLCRIGYPVVLAPSHKSFVGEVLDLPTSERWDGTAAVVAWGVLNGASLIRVHDVKSMKRVAGMACALRLPA